MGSGGRILTSANGNNWTVVQSKTSISLGGVARSATLYVAVGAAGTIVTSPEGAVSLTMKSQQPHPNPVKGTSVEQEEHPTPKDWVASLFALARAQGRKLDWTNCGLCVDERGAGDWIEGARRGGPKDFYAAAQQSTNVLVIPTH